MRGAAWSLILLAVLGLVGAVALGFSGLWWQVFATLALGGLAFWAGALLLFMSFAAAVHEEYRASLIEEDARLRKGDYVTIGENALTWRIVRTFGDQALLESGQSGRGRVEPLSALVLHTRVVA